MVTLKVYEFHYETVGGDGLTLIAAMNEESARECMAKEPVGFGRWEYCGEMPGLSQESKDNVPFIIRSISYTDI